MIERTPDEEHEHEGSFAEGQEEREHHPETEPKGDFAEGEEQGPTPRSRLWTPARSRRAKPTKSTTKNRPATSPRVKSGNLGSERN